MGEAVRRAQQRQCDLPFFRWQVYGARESSQGSALRCDERAKDARPGLTSLS